MSGLADDARILRARLAELEQSSKTQAAKVWAERKTADMEVVAEQPRTNRAEHLARIAYLEGDLHQVKGKLDFLKRLNTVFDSRYSMLVDKYDPFKCQIGSSVVCSGEIGQRLANASKYVDSLTDY